MSLEKPIFIVGVGRSGSTIFHKAFCQHPQVAWLSKICDICPKYPQFNTFLMHVHGTPGIGHIFERTILNPAFLKPSEAYNFWEYYCPGFSPPFRDLRADDVTQKKKKTLTQVCGLLTTDKRHRLLAKITGWPRIGFLQTIWPDAKFIHIVRDPRAVVNSILDVDWWDGWQGPQQWEWGELSQKHQVLWQSYDRSFVALAAIQIDILRTAMNTAKTTVKSTNFMEINYEELCQNPIETFQRVVDFCELYWTDNFAAKINHFSFTNVNYKWQEDLTLSQQEMVNSILAPYLDVMES